MAKSIRAEESKMLLVLEYRTALGNGRDLFQRVQQYNLDVSKMKKASNPIGKKTDTDDNARSIHRKDFGSLAYSTYCKECNFSYS